MIYPIERLRGDYCDCCNSERSIECYDKNNRPINYTVFIDMYMKDKEIIKKLDNRELSYMECKKCRKLYLIDWRYQYPMPMRNFGVINDFLYRNFNIT